MILNIISNIFRDKNITKSELCRTVLKIEGDTNWDWIWYSGPNS